MENQKLEKLKLAISQFYFNERLEEGIISDVEYDALAKEFENETGNSVKTLIEYRERRVTAGYFGELDKVAIDGDFTPHINNWITSNSAQYYFITPKYDGCSIQAIYERGRLKYVASTADQSEGIDRTQNLINIFPERVPESIKALQGEVIVDATTHGELARNAANGLVNSKYKVDECEKEAYVRIYNISFNTEPVYNMSHARRVNDMLVYLDEHVFAPINEKFGRKIIMRGFIFPQGFMIDKPIVDLGDGIKTQVDGVVVYSSIGIKAFKFYFTESAISTVTKINWNKKSNGSYAPVLAIETVVISGKTISNVSANGVPALMDMKCGVGSKIQIILANTVIPKVHKVLETSEDYQWPVCECGYQLGPNDAFGGTLKCGNDFCNDKIKLIKESLNLVALRYKSINMIISYDDFIKGNYFDIINCMKIDRWDAKSKFKNEDSVSISTTALQLYDKDNAANFTEYMHRYFNFSWLSERNMKIMAIPFIYALSEIRENFYCSIC